MISLLYFTFLQNNMLNFTLHLIVNFKLSFFTNRMQINEYLKVKPDELNYPYA